MNRRKISQSIRKALSIIAVLGLFATTTLMPPAVHAQQEDKKEQQNKRKDISKTQAADRARQQVKGRVLKVEKKKDEYRVKVLQKSGRVVSVDVDKNSGQVKNTKKKK